MEDATTKTIEDLEHDLREQIARSCEAGLSDKAMERVKKQLSDALGEAQSDFEYYLREDGAYNLGRFVVRMAEEAIEAILKGDDAEMRRRLHCVEGAWTGRDREHPVIHGRLFEQGAIALRKQIVEAHAELIKDQRILDLEDQVKSLVGQVNKAEAEKDRMWERLRPYLNSEIS